MKKIWICIGIAVILALLSGCGGGGGGGTTGGGTGGGTIPSATDLQALFPLTKGSQWTYNNTRSDTFSTTLGESRTETRDIKKTVTIPDPDTFTLQVNQQSVVAYIQLTHETGTVTKDGVTQQRDSWHRNFWTNQNGEVRLWGDQDWQPPNTPPPYNDPNQGTWENPNVFQLLVGKAGVSTWSVGVMSEDMHIAKVSFQTNATATWSTETVTVPAGTFNCNKVTITLSPPALQNVLVPSNTKVTALNEFTGKVEIWLFKGVGMVKSHFYWKLVGSFQRKDTGETGIATLIHDDKEELTSSNVK